MEPELENEEVMEDEVEEEVETSPAIAFAELVTEMAQQLDAGEMTVEDFVAQVTEQLNMMQADAPVDMASPMGGLGLGGGEFNLPDAE